MIREDGSELLANFNCPLGDPAEFPHILVVYVIIVEIGTAAIDFIDRSLFIPRSLRKSGMPHLIAILKVDIRLRRYTLVGGGSIARIKQLCQLIDVIGRRVHRNVDPNVLSSLICYKD